MEISHELVCYSCHDRVLQTEGLKHGAGGWRSEIEVWAVLVPPEAVRQESVPGFSPWLVHDCLLPVSLFVVFPVCLSLLFEFPFFITTPVILD